MDTLNKATFFILCFLFCHFNSKGQDLIILLDDTKYYGKIIDVNGPKYLIEIQKDGKTKDIVIKRKNVKGYVYGIDNYPNDSLNDKKQDSILQILKPNKLTQNDTIITFDNRRFIGQLLDQKGPTYRIRTLNKHENYTDWIIPRKDIRYMNYQRKRKKYNSIDDKRNLSLYFEGGGASFIYSLNVDIRFNKKKDGLGISFGAGSRNLLLARQNTDVASTVFLPLSLNYLVGDKTHFGEIGIGTNINNDHNWIGSDQVNKNWKPDPFLVFGYRYVRTNGIFFRAAITPFYSNNQFRPFYGGFAIGLNIQKSSK